MIERVFRERWGRVLASMVGCVGDFDLAEESTREAFAIALRLPERLRHAARRFGSVALHKLEHMVDEIAGWQAKQPSGIRYGRVQALRQMLEAAVRWGYMRTNPAKLAGRNRQPAPGPVRAFTRAELDAIAVELSPAYAPLPAFAAATGLRPEEWQALERHDRAAERTRTEGE